jgi:hypothetical protein
MALLHPTTILNTNLPEKKKKKRGQLQSCTGNEDEQYAQPNRNGEEHKQGHGCSGHQ